MDTFKSLKEFSDHYNLNLPIGSFELAKYEHVGLYNDVYLYCGRFNNVDHYYVVLTFSEAHGDELEVGRYISKWAQGDVTLLYKEIDSLSGDLQEGEYAFEVKISADSASLFLS